jgi:tRNA dimethylallyltransferase
MLEKGLVGEVQALLDAGYSPELSAMSAIGYKQIIKYLSGEISLEEAVRQIRSKWFQENDPDIHWFSAAADPTEKIIDEIQHFLS